MTEVETTLTMRDVEDLCAASDTWNFEPDPDGERVRRVR